MHPTIVAPRPLVAGPAPSASPTDPRRRLARWAVAGGVVLAGALALGSLGGARSVAASGTGTDASHVTSSVLDYPLGFRPAGPLTDEAVDGHAVRRDLLVADDGRWLQVDVATVADDTELRSLVEALGGQPGATGDGALAFAAADGVVGAARHHGTTAIVVTGGGGVDPDVVAAVAQSHAST